MGDLPNTWFVLHPTTYDPSNLSGGIHVNLVFSTNHGGDRCRLACPRPLQVFMNERRQQSLGDPLILMTLVLGLHRLIRSTRKWRKYHNSCQWQHWSHLSLWHPDGLQILWVLDNVSKKMSMGKYEGLPSLELGSDHWALACELCFESRVVSNYEWKGGGGTKCFIWCSFSVGSCTCHP